MPAGNPITSFRTDEALLGALTNRAEPYVRGQPGGLGGVASRDLDRYYALLAAELRRLELTPGEVALIADAVNGTYWEPNTIALLWAEIEDAIRLDRLDQKWQVHGPTLVAKLREATPGQLTAIADACERYWRRTPVDGERVLDGLRAVGLLR